MSLILKQLRGMGNILRETSMMSSFMEHNLGYKLGQPEPLVQRLQSFPLQRFVVGPRGYCGGDINELLSTQARSRAELIQGEAEVIAFSKV